MTSAPVAAGSRIVRIFFDIGANIGEFSIYAALRHPQLRVLSFEPEYSNLSLLKENIVDFHQHLKNPEVPLQIVNTLSLPANAEPGNYTLVISLHDRFANRHLTQQRTFQVVGNP